MLYDYAVKKPDDVIEQVFDFTAFVAQVAPEAVSFVGHGDIGPTYTEASNVDGLITLQIAGGTLGRTYLFGYSATTASGESQVDTRRLRIRDASPIAGIPITLDLALLTESGDTLITEAGDVLAFA